MKYPIGLIPDNGLVRDDPNLTARLQPVFAKRGKAPTITPQRPTTPSGKPGRIVEMLVQLFPEKKPPEVEAAELLEQVPVEEELEFDADMLHGVIDVGTIENSRLHQFQPTQVCARANGLPFAMQDSAKLAINQYRTVKPGNFSGAMKRVVQAIYGVGFVTDSSPDFITGLREPPPVRSTEHPLHYSYGFTRTHGIYKAGTKNHWLVEVSAANGVLAMPLPLFRNTMTVRYRRKMIARGDTDTIAVLDEYGGIPTGQTFPTGDALTAAIDAGRVLRLLEAADLSDFYDKQSFTEAWGWAFNSDGSACDNTCWEFLTSGDFTGYQKTYHYSIEIELSQHNTKALPFGSGSASLSLVSSGIVFAPWYETFAEKKSDACLFVPDSTLTQLIRFRLTGHTSITEELATHSFTKVKGIDDQNFFGMSDETIVKATTVPFPPPGGFPQICPDIGNAPVFVFYKEDDSREIVYYGTENASENYNVLWSDTIDRRVWETGTTRVAAHTIFIALPHCREGWAAYTHTGTQEEGDPSWDGVINFEVFTARGGLVALDPPVGYVDPGIVTSFPDDVYTAWVIEYRIGDIEWEDFFPSQMFFDVNENAGPADGYIRHNTIHFPDAPDGSPYEPDHSGEGYERLNARNIPLGDIVTKDVNWVGNV